MRLSILCLSLVMGIAAANNAAAFTISFVDDLFAPSFRGDANTTWVGWELFDDNGAGNMIINDVTPDIGTDTGSFVTTNGENHISGSFNYYSGETLIGEDVTVATDGVNGSGFTTIIIQAKTLFGGFGIIPTFSDIDGVSPTVVDGTNTNGEGQLFVKYEIPGTADPQTISLSGGFPTGPGTFGSFVSFDQLVVDTYWSPTAFAADTAVATPEPTAILLGALGLAGVAQRRRR